MRPASPRSRGPGRAGQQAGASVRRRASRRGGRLGNGLPDAVQRNGTGLNFRSPEIGDGFANRRQAAHMLVSAMVLKHVYVVE